MVFILPSQRKEIYKKYKKGQTIPAIAQFYYLQEDVIRTIVKSMEKEEMEQLLQEARCKTCRWRPCAGAPCCYRDKIDRDK